MNLKEMANLSNRQKKIGLTVISGLIVLTVVAMLSLPETPEPDTNLENTVELTHIEDNQLGNIIIQRNSDFPKLLQEPEYQACIYSNRSNAPVILDVDTAEVFISTDRIEVLDLNLTVTKDKIDREFPREEVNLTIADRCPLRNEAEIVITEK